MFKKVKLFRNITDVLRYQKPIFFLNLEISNKNLFFILKIIQDFKEFLFMYVVSTNIYLIKKET